MNSASEDLRDILEAESALGLVAGDNLHIGREPDTPNDTVTLYDTPGAPPQLLLGDEQYFYPSVQIRVRNSSYLAAWSMIDNIRTALHGRANEAWNGTLYTVIYVSSGPALLDWDENNRVRLIINFNIQRR